MMSSNLRGGMSFASQRYTESAVYEDLQGIPRTVDEHGRNNFILDIDCNNLYGIIIIIKNIIIIHEKV